MKKHEIPDIKATDFVKMNSWAEVAQNTSYKQKN